MAQLNFNAAQVKPQEAFKPIPAGWYNMAIIASEIKPTADKEGAYLQMTLKVLDGPSVNRQVIARLNIKNKNATAQEIAWQQLSAICHAVGVIQMQDSQQLHMKPLQVRVSVREAQGDYDASNEVKAFKAIEGQGVAPGAAGAANPAEGAPAWAGAQGNAQAPTPTPAAPAAVATGASSDASAMSYPGATAAVAPAANAAGNAQTGGGIPAWAKPAQPQG